MLGHLSAESRESAKQRAVTIVGNYEGQDINALSVLGYAVERGRFDEFATKLETHCRESLQYVHPEARKLVKILGAVRAERFFLNCYEDLGINPLTQ